VRAQIGRRPRGVPRARYEALLAEQGGRCGICGADVPGGPGLWAVDWDRPRGDPRGLLCRACHRGLRAFEHDPERLRAALRYLARRPSPRPAG
jgi:Recombination endonuclease VII